VNRIRPHLFVVFTLAALLLMGVPGVLKNALVDLRFEVFPRHATGDVVIVGIDPPSIRAIGVWPWPRRLHAELIEKLVGAGAGGIAFDIDFSSSSTPEGDQALAKALQGAGGSVILPSFEQSVKSGNGKILYHNHPLPALLKHAWPAIVNVSAEPDGVVRRYPYGDTIDGKFVPSMATLLADRYDMRKAPLWIDFSIRPDSIPVVSYKDVLNGEPAVLGRFKDKKIIVGGTALELGDRFTTPNGRIISGVVVQAVAAESILQGRALLSSSQTANFVPPLLVMIVMFLLWPRVSAKLRLASLAIVAVVAEITAGYLQARFAIAGDTSLLHLTIIAYTAAIALDEIDLRDLISLIAERRFHRIAMSLGDGLVCADKKGLITVWNPTAAAIFGYETKEALGHPLGMICLLGEDPAAPPFVIKELSYDQLQAPGGKLMEIYGRRKNGQLFPLEACFSAWPTRDDFHYGAIFRDISVRRREAARVLYLAEHDQLTGLANRHVLATRVRNQAAEIRPGSEIALIVLGLDRFQFIIDMLGHDYGEQVIRAAAERLAGFADPASLVARLDGDEFAVLVEGENAAARAEKLAEDICHAFAERPFTVASREQVMTASAGIAVFPRDCRGPDDLLGNAHLALYRAKSVRRGRHFVFHRRFRQELETRARLEAELARAIERNEFELFYQPKVSLEDDTVVGAEALIRWHHPYRGLVGPSEFMHVVKTSALSDPISTWVMHTACAQAGRWRAQGFDVSMAVNLVPSQIRAKDLVRTVESVLKANAYPPSQLELEVTEDILVDDENALETFRKIKKLGVKLLLDDFGTGYASLSYLKNFPLSGLKIDKSFVGRLRLEIDDAAIVGSIVGLGTLLGLTVIAEGIEDRSTANLVARMGCKLGQGYFFGEPMPAAEFEQRFLSGSNEDTTAALRAS
jgi:diguanylate cyclase (GGDEF)-like protein/PAS domain S-box-containing protein